MKQTQTADKPVSVKAEPEADDVSLARWLYIALLAVGVVVLGLSAAFALQHTVPGWEVHGFTVVNHLHWPRWVGEQVAKPLSNAVWGMLGLIVIFLFIPKFRWRAWQYGVAAGSAYVTVFVIEHLIDRARPALLVPGAILRGMQDGPGFPSGHVAVLTALCLTIWAFVSWPWRVLLVLLVGAEAWARIYLGVHMPLDVVGGAAVAGIVVAVLHLAPEKLRKLFYLA